MVPDDRNPHTAGAPPTSVRGETMRAFVQDTYGPPEQLRLATLDAPEPAAGEVLVRVHATSVNPYDWHSLRGEPYVARLMPGGLGARRPRIPLLGCDVAGRVVAAGAGVTAVRPGDDVIALLPGGGFGELVAAPEHLVARMPGTLSYAQAGAVPMAAVTALEALRVGGLEAGRRVLVTGASGGVGTFAVQLARTLGASVTAVCSTPHVAVVATLGADRVVDRTTEDVTRGGRHYDLVLDCAGGWSLRDTRSVLLPGGVLVGIGGPAGRWVQPAGRAIATRVGGPFGRGRVAAADTVASPRKQEHLATVAGLIERGVVRPVVDRVFPFEELPTAVRYQEQGRATGKVVVQVTAGA
jgi:NADPH:quinone reductase-like Zn-dependent oxidoreductase